jgi:hypothetical protein
MAEENKNSEALAILDAPATTPAVANTSQIETMGVTAADTPATGTTTPADTVTAQAVPSPSSEPVPAASPTAPTGTTPTTGGDTLYKPMFSVRTEKAIYVTCVLLSLGAIVVSVIAGDLNWPRVVGDTCGVMGGLVGSLASAFGVSYTTMRMM